MALNDDSPECGVCGCYNYETGFCPKHMTILCLGSALGLLPPRYQDLVFMEDGGKKVREALEAIKAGTFENFVQPILEQVFPQPRLDHVPRTPPSPGTKQARRFPPRPRERLTTPRRPAPRPRPPKAPKGGIPLKKIREAVQKAPPARRRTMTPSKPARPRTAPSHNTTRSSKPSPRPRRDIERP